MNQKYNLDPKFIKCAWCPKPAHPRRGEGFVIIPYKGKNGLEVCHKCAPCVKCGKEACGEKFNKYEKTSDNPSGAWELAHCSIECFNGTEKPSLPKKEHPQDTKVKCDNCGKLDKIKVGNAFSGKNFCSEYCYDFAKAHKGYNNNQCRIAGCSKKAYYECMDLCLSHSKPCKGGKIKPGGKICKAAIGSDEGDICEFCKNQDNKKQSNENQVSRLFKFTSHITGKGIDSSNWNYFYYIFTSSDGKIIEVNAQNPAIGKKTWPRRDGNEKVGINYWYKISWKETEKDKWSFEKGDFIEIEKQEQLPESGFKNVKLVNNNDNNISKKGNSGENNLTKPSDLPINKSKSDNETLIINLNSIKKVTLSGNNLVIEFKSSEMNNNKLITQTQNITAEQINSNQELQKIRDYCQKNNKSSLNNKEIDSLINSNSISTKELKNNVPLLVGGGIVVLVLGVVIGVLVKKRVKKSK